MDRSLASGDRATGYGQGGDVGLILVVSAGFCQPWLRSALLLDSSGRNAPTRCSVSFGWVLTVGLPARAFGSAH